MKTVSFEFRVDDEELQQAIAEDSRVCSSMRRYAFNRLEEGVSTKETYGLLGKLFPTINSHLRNSALRSASGLLVSWNARKEKEGNKLHFGKFKRYCRGLITKEEYKDSRNTGIYSEGETPSRGNRFFKIDTENNKIIWKRSAKEHYDLEFVEKLSDKRKNILSKLQLLMSEKKVPVTVRVKNDTIYLTYDESVVESEKRFKNLFQNRVLGIDLNPNYFGISVIEFNKKDEYKIIHRECIDLTELQEQSSNKIKFELYEINHYILRLCKHYHIGKLSVEDLKFDTKKKFWSKKLNRLCRNRFRFSTVKTHLHTLCNTFGVELVEINPAYSSIIGNFRHGSDKCPDPIAASIEIARRAYHKFQKGWFQPSFVSKERLRQVLGTQWKDEPKLGCKTWKGLAGEIKELGLKYRFPLLPSMAVLSKNHVKRRIILHTF